MKSFPNLKLAFVSSANNNMTYKASKQIRFWEHSGNVSFWFPERF